MVGAVGAAQRREHAAQYRGGCDDGRVNEAIGQVLPLGIGVALSPVPIIAVVLIVVIGFKILGDGIAGL